MDSEISHSASDEASSDSSEDVAVPTTSRQAGRGSRGRGRGRARGTGKKSSTIRLRLHKRNEQEIISGLLRKKQKLRELVGEMKKSELQSVVIKTIEKSPDVLWDVLGCESFSTPQTHSDSPGPSHPSPGPSDPEPTTGPSWCTCSNCRDMPTEEERICCGKQPAFCLSNLPHFQLIALDENVLHLANLHQNDILAYPEEADVNRGYRHAAYRQFILWIYGRLGAGVRHVIPSCCVWKIRDKFPDQNGYYTGYIPGRLG